MIRLVVRNIIRFLVLLLAQVLVFENVNLGGNVNPYFYVLFVLLMPFETPKWTVLLTAFALGFSVDIFTHTMGIL